MGIPIEPRLSKAALAKRQRSAALRKTRNVFNYVASGQTTSFGMYQENLDNLISHARDNPPQSARLILVSKDLSAPAPISSREASIIRMFPLFMRRGRHGTVLGEHGANRFQYANEHAQQSSSSSRYNAHGALRRRSGPESSDRAQFTWDLARRTLLHVRVNRIMGPHTSARPSNPGHNSSRRAPSLSETHSRSLPTSQMHQAPSRSSRRFPFRDSSLWAVYRQSMLLAASADSLSRVQNWGTFLDSNGRDNTSRANEHDADGGARRLAPSGTQSRPSLSLNSQSSIQDYRDLMSDKAISMLYEVDNGCLWELGCWVGTQHLRTTEIFGILIEVLEKTSGVAGSPVEALCIQDNLFSYSTVRGGVSLLKELSGQLHDSYDRTSDFFVHPMNEQRVQIIVTP
ncbi:unnamed protein product [Agarophyton chilense]